MKISTVIPIYNCREFANQCFDSVLCQKNTDLELVVVDDGSCDDSDAICCEYALKYPNVTVISQKNGGASAARNTGLSAATGEYIHFIDSDDFLPYDDIYSVRSECFEQNTDILFSRYIGYKEDLSAEEEHQQPYKDEGFFEGDVLYKVLNDSYNMVLTCPVNKIIRRDFLLCNNLFFTRDIDHEEDEWLPRVIANARKVYFDNGFIYAVRCHRNGSVSSVYRNPERIEQYLSYITIAKIGTEYMVSLNLPKETESKIIAYYWEYLINGVLGIGKMSDKSKRKFIYDALKQCDVIFDKYKCLSSCGWRLMGWMFLHLGVRITGNFVCMRYRYST